MSKLVWLSMCNISLIPVENVIYLKQLTIPISRSDVKTLFGLISAVMVKTD